uniref:Uncharacterized protein n=1 Tax=Aegilops tauschii subsp. strangulata TaxID=200361 RepID=A0A452YH56_AEGTS
GKRSDRRAEREERKVRGVTGDWSVERQTPSGTPTNADERHCEVLSVCPQNPEERRGRSRSMGNCRSSSHALLGKPQVV